MSTERRRTDFMRSEKTTGSLQWFYGRRFPNTKISPSGRCSCSVCRMVWRSSCGGRYRRRILSVDGWIFWLRRCVRVDFRCSRRCGTDFRYFARPVVRFRCLRRWTRAYVILNGRCSSRRSEHRLNSVPAVVTVTAAVNSRSSSRRNLLLKIATLLRTDRVMTAFSRDCGR